MKPDAPTVRTDATAQLAAASVNLRRVADKRYIGTVVPQSRATGMRRWEWFEKLGEIHYSVGRSARIAGYAQIMAVEIDPTTSRVIRVIDNDATDLKAAATIASTIYSPFGGVRGLVERFYTLMKVPGDAYLIRVKEEGEFRGFHFASADELPWISHDGISGSGVPAELKWTTMPVTDGGDRITRTLARSDFLGRLWMPGQRWVDLPESPLSALDVECENLHTLSLNLKAKLQSRFALAGILFMPAGLTKVTAMEGDKVVESTDLAKKIVEIMTRNVLAGGEAADIAPALLVGESDLGEKIKHIVLDKDIAETDIKMRAELIQRILFGLDIQQQATQGNEDTNHFNAWAATDEERRIAVQPELEMLCAGLTKVLLHKQLRDIGWSDDKILRTALWFRIDRASVRANQQEDARQMRDRGLLSGLTTLEASGFSKSDMPTEQEYVRWTGHQVKDPYLMLFEGDKIADVDWDKVGVHKPGPAASSPGEDPSAGPGVGDPGSPDSGRRDDTPRRKRPV